MLHGLVELTLQGSSNAPRASSSNPKRKPASLAHLQVLLHALRLMHTFDVAVFAIACVAFWGQCRLAELTMDGPFDPTKHASRAAWLRDGILSSNIKHGGFQAPKTKTSPRGEDILWTDSKCSCSTLRAFNNHMQISSHVPSSAPLFMYETENGIFAPMKRHYSMDRCTEIWVAKGLEPLSGHAFCIGGTMHLLVGFTMGTVNTTVFWSQLSRLQLRCPISQHRAYCVPSLINMGISRVLL